MYLLPMLVVLSHQYNKSPKPNRRRLSYVTPSYHTLCAGGYDKNEGNHVYVDLGIDKKRFTAVDAKALC